MIQTMHHKAHQKKRGIICEERSKFPQGLMRIGITGRIFKAHNKLTVEQVCEKHGIRFERDFWLPNGKKAAVEDKLRYYFPPGEEIQYIDEVIPGDPRKLRKKVGLVKLRIEGKSIVVQNNQSFEEAFTKKSIEIQTELILLPNQAVPGGRPRERG
jgi:hypothetical protein